MLWYFSGWQMTHEIITNATMSLGAVSRASLSGYRKPRTPYKISSIYSGSIFSQDNVFNLSRSWKTENIYCSEKFIFCEIPNKF